jgi:hypothetical protein
LNPKQAIGNGFKATNLKVLLESGRSVVVKLFEVYERGERCEEPKKGWTLFDRHLGY